MPSTKNLKGIPGNIALSYLSTNCTYENGYMGDWINYIARSKKIPLIEIDILNKQVTPKEAEHLALLCYLDKLQDILYRELEINSFNTSFIIKAALRFEIPILTSDTTSVYCYPFMEDTNGKIYTSKHRFHEVSHISDPRRGQPEVKNAAPKLLKTQNKNKIFKKCNYPYTDCFGDRPRPIY